jgi:SIR2-like domain
MLGREIKKVQIPNFYLDEYRNTPPAGLADLNLPIYITTNYDYFIEEALKAKGKQPISDFCRWNEDLVEYANENEINAMVYSKFP